MENAIKMQRSLDKITDQIKKKNAFNQMVEDVQSIQQTKLDGVPAYY
jgi:hypothetical protein